MEFQEKNLIQSVLKSVNDGTAIIHINDNSKSKPFWERENFNLNQFINLNK